jgi:hypothetical protein
VQELARVKMGLDEEKKAGQVVQTCNPST